MVARFSSVAGRPGAADAERDLRAFLKVDTRQAPGPRRQRSLELIIRNKSKKNYTNAIGDKHGRED